MGSASMSESRTAASQASAQARKSGSRPSSARQSSLTRPCPLSVPMEFAVVKPRKTSPLPWPMYEPQRTSPTVARLTTRPSWRELSGASVATTTMIDPRSGRSAAPSSSAMRLPTGLPSTMRSGMRPKLLCTSTPTT